MTMMLATMKKATMMILLFSFGRLLHDLVMVVLVFSLKLVFSFFLFVCFSFFVGDSLYDSYIIRLGVGIRLV